MFRWLRRRAGYDGASIDVSSARLNHSRCCHCAVGGVVSLEIGSFPENLEINFRKFPVLMKVLFANISGKYFLNILFTTVAVGYLLTLQTW